MRKTISLITALYLTLIFPWGSLAQEAGQGNALSIVMEFKDPFIPLLPKKDVVQTPTATVATTQTPTVLVPPQLRITGLIWNSTKPQAIINNQVVGIGDAINDVTIVGIQKTSIDIVYQGTYFSIDPNSQTVKVKNDTRSP